MKVVCLGELSQLRVDVVRAIECSPLPFAGKARIGTSRRVQYLGASKATAATSPKPPDRQPEHLQKPILPSFLRRWSSSYLILFLDVPFLYFCIVYSKISAAPFQKDLLITMEVQLYVYDLTVSGDTRYCTIILSLLH